MVLATLVALISIVVGPTASAREPHGISCRLTGVLSFRPALVLEPQDLKIRVRGHMTHCVGSDDSVTSGDFEGRASSTGGCSLGRTEIKIAVQWDDGSETAMRFSAESLTGAAVLHGRAGASDSSVVDEGDPVGGFLMLDADPARCLSGLRTARFQGQGFGGNAP